MEGGKCKYAHAKKTIEVNKILQSKCNQNQFIFVFIGNLCGNHLHLTFQGTCKLANNFGVFEIAIYFQKISKRIKRKNVGK